MKILRRSNRSHDNLTVTNGINRVLLSYYTQAVLLEESIFKDKGIALYFPQTGGKNNRLSSRFYKQALKVE